MFIGSPTYIRCKTPTRFIFLGVASWKLEKDKIKRKTLARLSLASVFPIQDLHLTVLSPDYFRLSVCNVCVHAGVSVCACMLQSGFGQFLIVCFRNPLAGRAENLRNRSLL